MAISFEIELSDDERAQLAEILQHEVDDLDTALTPYARAAFQEYVRMFLGQKVFTRGSEINEYRLSLLIREAFNNEIPDEQEVCNLFQTTATQSRSLIRSVMSKYQYDLHSAIERTLRNELENAEQEDGEGDWILTTNSENVIEALNRRLASIDGSLPQVSNGEEASQATSYDRPHTSVLPTLLLPENDNRSRQSDIGGKRLGRGSWDSVRPLVSGDIGDSESETEPPP